MLVDIDAGHVATASLSQIEGRPSGAAAHVEDLTAGPDRGLVGDMQPFFGSHPTALADILAVGLAPDGLFGCAREMAVRMIIEVDSSLHGRISRDGDSIARVSLTRLGTETHIHFPKAYKRFSVLT